MNSRDLMALFGRALAPAPKPAPAGAPQTVFSAIAPTLEHFGVLEIALTGADWTRRSHEIVATSGSSGSSMPIASPAPEWACG